MGADVAYTANYDTSSYAYVYHRRPYTIGLLLQLLAAGIRLFLQLNVSRHH